MLINNAVITGSFIVNGVDVVRITGSSAISSSFLALSSSYVITSASYAQSSASLSIRTGNLEATSSTLVSASSSFAAQSASFSSRVSIVEGQDATTGSNTFTGVQYVSEASNAISFTSTASLYTDGGFRVAKDSFVSGTAYFNNIIVYGTSSIEYITSSQVDIGANIITVNTDTPTVRFGGLSVFDSGSTQLTGSMLWDSETNHWVYSNPSGSSYSGGMIMSGPRASSLGTEQGTTNNALMKGQGGDHITSSQIIDDGTTVRIPGNFQVTGSTILSSAAFTGSVNVTGSFIVTTTGTELQVTSTGVNLGNIITDNHNVTGSLRVSGSATFVSSLSTSDLFVGATSTSAAAKAFISQTAGSTDFANNSTLFLSAQNANTTANLIRFNGAIAKGLVFGRGINVDDFVWGFTDSTTPVMTLTSAGNLGIGTITPTAIGDYKAITLSGTDGSFVDFRFNNSGYGRVFTNSVTALGLESLSTTLPLVFKTQNGSGSTERMTILPNGNVGIGNWSSNIPQDLLHVNGAIQVGFVNSLNSAMRLFWNGASSYGAIQTSSSSALALNPAGNNVLIGGTTESGIGKLQVSEGDIYAQKASGNPALYLRRVNTSTNFEISCQETRTRIRTFSTGNDRDLLFDSDNAGTTRMTITGGGYISLNNVVYGNTVNTSPRTLYIESGTGSLGGISSIRASKKNIESIKNISWIYQLKPVAFNYRKKDKEGNYTEEIYNELNCGLIAEDTAPIADFLINYNDKKEMIGIEYSRLITPMLKAIQELKAELDTAKTEINELKNK